MSERAGFDDAVCGELAAALERATELRARVAELAAQPPADPAALRAVAAELDRVRLSVNGTMQAAGMAQRIAPDGRLTT